MEKKNVILLTVIAVATLLITVVGATFAFYAAQVDGTPTEINVTSANGLAITFDDGDTLTASNIIPGWTSKEKTVKVSNSGNYELEYKITWKGVTNTISDKEHLTYSATVASAFAEDDKHTDHTSSATSNITKVATPETIGLDSPEAVFATQKIKPGEEITYTITLNYEDTGNAQGNPTESQSFVGTLELTDKNVKVISTTPSLPATD